MEENRTPREADVTKEDIKNLGDKAGNLRRDGGDDRFLRDRMNETDFAGKDLDVPGRALPNERDLTTAKDEENQLYSQGGDGNGHLESNSK